VLRPARIRQKQLDRNERKGEPAKARPGLELLDCLIDDGVSTCIEWLDEYIVELHEMLPGADANPPHPRPSHANSRKPRRKPTTRRELPALASPAVETRVRAQLHFASKESDGAHVCGYKVRRD
jgi:hypothetical protein